MLEFMEALGWEKISKIILRLMTITKKKVTINNKVSLVDMN